MKDTNEQPEKWGVDCTNFAEVGPEGEMRFYRFKLTFEGRIEILEARVTNVAPTEDLKFLGDVADFADWYLCHGYSLEACLKRFREKEKSAPGGVGGHEYDRI